MDHQYQRAAGFAILLQDFNEKGCLLVWGGDALRLRKEFRFQPNFFVSMFFQ
jgi:hypothetical protein